MINYRVEFQKIDILDKDAEPFGDYQFYVQAVDFPGAAKKAVPLLARIGFAGMNHDIYNARIVGPAGAGEPYEIIRDGSWLIDFETGEKESPPKISSCSR